MDRLTLLVQNRLLLAGAPSFEAPYDARDAVALGRELGVTDDADVVRLALIARAMGPILARAPAEAALVHALLQRQDVPAAARLDLLEQTWLGRPRPEKVL